VRGSLTDADATVPTPGALCFVDADLPILGALTFNGYPLLYVKALAKRCKPGPVPDEPIRRIAADLARTASRPRS
jgi:hypothetical protein